MQANRANQQDLISRLHRTEGYLASDPSNVELLARAIDLSLEAHDLDRAAGHAEHARAHHPADPYLQCRYGHVLLAQGKASEAAPVFSGLLDAHPDVHLAYGLAACQLAGGAWADALATLAPYRDDPSLPPEAVSLMVRALHQLGDYAAGAALVEAWQEALQDHPDFCAAAGLFCLDAGQFDRAAALAERAMAAGQHSLEVLVTSATVALGRTDAELARQRFKEALAMNPSEGRSWSGLGMASMLGGDMAGAALQFEQAVRFMPAHIGSWHALGWCKLFAEDLDAAEDAFSAALAIDRNFGETHGALAVVAAHRGLSERARAGIEVALRLDAQCLSARYAEMALNGQLADPERFKAIALRLIRHHKTPAGEELGSVVERLARH